MDKKDLRQSLRKVKGDRLFYFIDRLHLEPKDFQDFMGYQSTGMMSHLKSGKSWMKKEDLERAAKFLGVPAFVLEIPEPLSHEDLELLIAFYDEAIKKKDSGVKEVFRRMLIPGKII